MYVVLVAAEIYGRKHNIEIGFPDVPSLDELAGHAERTFQNECRRLRPAHAQTQKFVVENIKIFDDSLNRWLDLTTTAQLLEWSQLYLVQADGIESGEQGLLEPPVRLRSPLDQGSDKEKYFFLFHDMDFNGNGHLSRDELQRIFNVLCVYDLSEEDVDRYFHKYDTNRDNVLSFAEFSKWMQATPEIGDILLRKSVDYWSAWKRRPDIRDSSQVSRSEREAIFQFLERGRNMTEDMRRQQEELRRASDERLLQEREEELYRAKNRYQTKYGAEPSPSPSRQSSFSRPASNGGSAKKLRR